MPATKEQVRRLAESALNNKGKWFTYQRYLEKMNDMYNSSKPVTKEQWDLIIECTPSAQKMGFSHYLKESAELVLSKIDK